MAVSPKDILEKEFNTKFKGYDPQEVDLFLDEIMTEFASLIDERDSLASRVRSLEAQVSEYKEKEDKLTEAEDKIMSTVLAAQRNAQIYLSKVEVQAQGIMDGATKNAKAIIEGAQIKMENIRTELQKYESLVQDYKERFRSFLEDQFAYMNNNLDQSDIERSVADITRSINKLQQEAAGVGSQYESISVSDILSESASTPKDEAPIAEMEEIKILVDELDAE